MLTMSKAAKALGISRTALRKWIRKLDIATVAQGQALCLTPEDLELIRKARKVRSPRNASKKKASTSSDASPALHDLQIQLREAQQREHELLLQNEVLLQEKKDLNETLLSAPASSESSEIEVTAVPELTPTEEEDPLHFFPSGKDFSESPKKVRPELWKIFLHPGTLNKTQENA